MTDEEKQETCRSYAERIIAGEYKNVAIAIIDDQDKVECFYDGSAVTALGMTEILHRGILRDMEQSEEED